jgi:hypothetical protein
VKYAEIINLLEGHTRLQAVGHPTASCCSGAAQVWTGLTAVPSPSPPLLLMSSLTSDIPVTLHINMSTITPTTCFFANKLNDTTFVIVEDDKWNENPYIYVKLTPNSLVLIDTGCGGAAKDPSVELSSLRTFIETFPVADNAGEPLNEKGTRNYVIICTHCHFDHIGLPPTLNFSSKHLPSQVASNNSQTPKAPSGRAPMTKISLRVQVACHSPHFADLSAWRHQTTR